MVILKNNSKLFNVKMHYELQSYILSMVFAVNQRQKYFTENQLFSIFSKTFVYVFYL